MLIVAACAALYSLWTLYGAGGEAFLWSLVLFLAGAPIYFAMKAKAVEGSEMAGKQGLGKE